MNYTPRLLDENQNSVFNGHVEIDMPTYKERITLLKKVGTDVEGDKIIEKADVLADITMKHVVKTELVHVQTETDFNSLDELSHYAEGTQLINELASVILNGIPLGKISKPS